MSTAEVTIELHKLEPDETVVRIRKLHGEVIAAARTTVAKAIEIGEILANKKKELGHGNWLPWVKLLPFSYRTAERYMGIFERQDKLDNVSNLSEAYRLGSATLDAETLSSLEDGIRDKLSEFVECGAALEEMNRRAPDRLREWIGDDYNFVLQYLEIWQLIVSNNPDDRFTGIERIRNGGVKMSTPSENANPAGPERGSCKELN
jgi:hypothetical protein